MEDKLACLSNRCRLVDETSIVDCFKDIDTVCCDCDGVLWKGSNVILGAPEAIEKIKSLGKNVLFVTNNSTLTRERHLKRFKILGFKNIQLMDIYTAGFVAAQYISHVLNYKGKVYCIGSRSLSEELSLEKIDHFGTGEEDENVLLNTIEDFEEFEPDLNVKCVLVGLDFNFNYSKAVKAAAYLQDKNVAFIVTNNDPNFPGKKNRVIPCCGSITSMIKSASGRKVDFMMGKPGLPMYRTICMFNEIDPKRTIMIGDRLNTDILFANRCGFRSLLVLSGISTLDEARTSEYSDKESVRLSSPDFYIHSIAQLIPLLDQLYRPCDGENPFC